jgi:hypothetical protein
MISKIILIIFIRLINGSDSLGNESTIVRRKIDMKGLNLNAVSNIQPNLRYITLQSRYAAINVRHAAAKLRYRTVLRRYRAVKKRYMASLERYIQRLLRYM